MQMETLMMILSIFFFSLFPIIITYLLLGYNSSSNRTKLPPGSLGLPVIGQSLQLLRAMRANTAEKWVQDRVRKYGPVSKLSIFGKPAVLIHGQAANKFVFTSGRETIAYEQTKSIRMILGDRNLFELSVEDHKRVRNALVSFLKPESLKQYVGKIDAEVRDHIQTHWIGKETVAVLPLTKKLTFNIICTLLFGLDHGPRRQQLADCFQEMIKGMWSIPIRLPFTHFNNSVRASQRVQGILKELLHERRAELLGSSKHRDLITCMLCREKEEKKEEEEEEEEGADEVVTEKEILHNSMLVMVAGHDTTSVLITFMLRLMSNDHAIYSAVLQEQEEIAKKKAPEECLTWEDLSKMKYTWRVAMEILRMIPPVFGGFRKAQRDIEYGGYLIPKDWPIFWVSSLTQMDETIFKDPWKFDPNRFESSVVPPYSFVAFGGGPRICPGNEFARTEILVAIHYLVRRFTWKLLSDNSFTRDPMPTPSQGLKLHITQRN